MAETGTSYRTGVGLSNVVTRDWGACDVTKRGFSLGGRRHDGNKKAVLGGEAIFSDKKQGIMGRKLFFLCSGHLKVRAI